MQKNGASRPLQRDLVKINYRIHTDAIKEHPIPEAITPAHANMFYASEADILNVALFGQTAAEWHRSNPDISNFRGYLRGAN